MESPFSHPVSRRCLLQAGTLASLGGSGAPCRDGWHRYRDAGVWAGEALIFLFMWGGPSHVDTFDMKPDAPDEIRGPFRPIATSVPGISICEHFPTLAPLMDRVAVVRSLTHDDPAHLSSVHTLLTGQLPPVNKSDDVPPSPRDTPHIGSVMAKLRFSSGRAAAVCHDALDRFASGCPGWKGSRTTRRAGWGGPTTHFWSKGTWPIPRGRFRTDSQ